MNDNSNISIDPKKAEDLKAAVAFLNEKGLSLKDEIEDVDTEVEVLDEGSDDYNIEATDSDIFDDDISTDDIEENSDVDMSDLDSIF